MKNWTTVLNAVFVILNWIALILLAPMTLSVALGFILFTAFIGRQIQNDEASRWTQVA